MHVYLCNRIKGKTSQQMVSLLLRDYASENGLSLSDDRICNPLESRTPQGKPYFVDPPQVHFSVSHSGIWWACAFDSSPVGLDIEDLSARRNKANYNNGNLWPRIAKRFFTQEEYEYVLNGGEEAFFHIWVRKEAYLKYIGTGIGTGLSSFNLVEKKQIVKQVGPAYLEEINFCSDIIAACCSSTKTKITIKNIEMIQDEVERDRHN
jgi:4'-phosphopantetheinyl transferase